MPASLTHQKRMLAHLERQQTEVSPLDLAWERIKRARRMQAAE